MHRTLLMDQFHLSISVPRGLPESSYRDLRRTLDNPRLQVALQRAVRGGSPLSHVTSGPISVVTVSIRSPLYRTSTVRAPQLGEPLCSATAPEKGSTS